ncbi:MAG: hypothetical protein IPH32_15745 [Bacteroidetes bacterium]|nr:hypothetical protein [Bacteroidota bacterium]
MQKTLVYIFSLCITLYSLHLKAQIEPQLNIALLGNDKIAEVNMNQDGFIKSIGEITDLTKKEFTNGYDLQKVAILITVHKKGSTSIELHANPQLPDNKSADFLKKLQAVAFENMKLVDFPLAIFVRSTLDDAKNDFKDLVLPADKIDAAYLKSNLKEKMELNKIYAITEVLPVLAAYQVMVNDQFVGVKNFGKLIQESNYAMALDVEQLTSRNKDYWRACMEMNAGNQLITVSKIALLVSQGEFDYATKYIEMIRMYSDPKAVPHNYLKEMSRRLEEFSKQLETEKNRGILEHDKGNYAEAIAIYQSILKKYPNSAGVKYELYYSKNALDIETKKIELDNRKDWDEAKISIYKSNPIYGMDVRASNGKEGYLLFRRQSIQELFKNRDDKTKIFIPTQILQWI